MYINTAAAIITTTRTATTPAMMPVGDPPGGGAGRGATCFAERKKVFALDKALGQWGCIACHN